MIREQFRRLKYGDRISKMPRSRIVCTVLENRLDDAAVAAIRLGFQGRDFLISDPRWWVKLPERK